MRIPARLLRTLRRLVDAWLYCLLQGLLSLVDIAFWLVGIAVSPVLALLVGPRLVAVLETWVNWLADLNVRLVTWRQRRPTGAPLDDEPWRRHSTWKSLRCLGVNALSMPVHLFMLVLFPVTVAWAPVHSRLLRWTLSERVGTPRSEPDRHGGHGLVGMRERVRALGGTLETGPDDRGGFRVLAALPLDPAPGAPGQVDTETAPTLPESSDEEDG